MRHRPTLPRLKGFRFPREIIACAVRACRRLAPSAADVEDLPAERGVTVGREAIRLWVSPHARRRQHELATMPLAA